MGLVVARLVVQADHEVGVVALLAQEPEEDERRGQAPRAERAEVQALSTARPSRDGGGARVRDPGKVVRESGERRPASPRFTRAYERQMRSASRAFGRAPSRTAGA